MQTNFLIYFGNIENSINPDCYKNPEKQQYIDFLERNLKNFNLDNLIFPKQVHGTKEIIISGNNLISNLIDKSNSFFSKFPSSWQTESDYIITDIKNLGIGVLTADCLPIIITGQINSNHLQGSEINLVCAIIHAGWRGTVNGIIENCINSLINKFNLNPEKLSAYFGPCAKSCCYEVQTDFVNNLSKEFHKYLIYRENKIYFDLSKLAQNKLECLGINKQKICLKQNLCTICSPDFCSVRLDKSCNRQISVVAIKD